MSRDEERVEIGEGLEEEGTVCKTSCDWIQFSSVQLLSCVRLFVTPWTTVRQASLSITNSWSPPKPVSIESMMPSNHLILCQPLLRLPSIFPSIRAFSNESAICIRWPKYCSFSFNISPSSEHPGLISFRMDWLDLLAVQGTLYIYTLYLSVNTWYLSFPLFLSFTYIMLITYSFCLNCYSITSLWAIITSWTKVYSLTGKCLTINQLRDKRCPIS